MTERRDFVACFYDGTRLVVETDRMSADGVRADVLSQLRDAHGGIVVTVYRSGRALRGCNRASVDEAQAWAQA